MAKPGGPKGWLTRALARADAGIFQCRTGLVPCTNSPQIQLLINGSEEGMFFPPFKWTGYQVEHQAVLSGWKHFSSTFLHFSSLSGNVLVEEAPVGLPSARSNRNKKPGGFPGQFSHSQASQMCVSASESLAVYYWGSYLDSPERWRAETPHFFTQACPCHQLECEEERCL